MAQMNTRARSSVRTHEGAPAVPNKSALAELDRAVMAAFLWEDQFYESGQSLAERIGMLSCQVSQFDAEAVAYKARTIHNLRHVPMWVLASRFAAKLPVSAYAVASILQRADEPGELISMYWKDGKRPLPAQMKLGIAQAMTNFDAYQLAKYDRPKGVKLRDVLRLVHPTPVDEEQSENWRKLIAGELQAPDTWEVQLSSGADKRETFERLLREGKLGYMALLRNLRNMVEAGVDRGLVEDALIARKGAHRVLPFRFVAASRAAPSYGRAIDTALLANIEGAEPFPGRTIVAVDTSGSMQCPLSERSGMTRVDAAGALAALIPGEVRLFSFASGIEELPARKGLAGVDAVWHAVGRVGHGTDIDLAVRTANGIGYDRLFVITDGQSHTSVGGPLPGSKGYMINVASYQNGVGFGDWVTINGFSESVFKFARAYEGWGGD